MTHRQRVLLVENNEGNRREIKRWLQNVYHVEVALSLEEAKTCLLNNHYHVVVVDINLDEQSEQNKDGYWLIHWIATEPSLEELLCIVITAYDRGDLAIESFNGRLPIQGWVVKRLSYRQDLQHQLSNTFSDNVRINFDLDYDADSEKLLPQMAGNIEWPEGAEKPNEEMLVEEIRDLIGKHFRKASRVFLRRLTKGLSGAAVVRVKAKWDSDIAYGSPQVLKISRREKVLTEFENFDKYVDHRLPNNTAVNAQVVYAGHLGAIQYSFAEDANRPLDEFDVFFQRETTDRISFALRTLFRETCRHWYESPETEFKNLITLYYQALNLNEDKLTSRIHQFLPELDLSGPRLSLPNEPTDLINPLFWLQTNHDQCTVRICQSINHGDLTGRNVFVNEHGHCWLIDFFRTYRSHMLRDFVILETDIKYRLLPELFEKARRPDQYSLAEYRALEQALSRNELTSVQVLSPEVQKAAEALLTIRSLADELMIKHHHDGDNIRRQVLISRLMTHLNVTRLRHIQPCHKLWALTTAAHICEELDQLPPPR